MTNLPPVLVAMAVEPKEGRGHDAMLRALAMLAAEDPSFRVSTDPESGRTFIKGMGEHHLDRKVDALRDDHGIEVNLGAPQVMFLETVTRRVEVDYTHKRQAGGTGQFARIKLVIEPSEPGRGFAFEPKIAGGAVPAACISGVEKGLASVLGAGVVAGFPVVDVKVALTDGAWHEVDSSALTFEIAARAAFHEGLQQAGSILLEPIMKVEVATPEDHAVLVVRDLVSRRGRILGQSQRGGARVVDALLPLMNMFGYVNHLRSFTRGRASYTMQFDHYAPAPLPDGDDPNRPMAAASRVA